MERASVSQAEGLVEGRSQPASRGDFWRKLDVKAKKDGSTCSSFKGREVLGSEI